VVLGRIAGAFRAGEAVGREVDAVDGVVEGVVEPGGPEGAYTNSVESFLQTLDYSLARALRNGRSGRSS